MTIARCLGALETLTLAAAWASVASAQPAAASLDNLKPFAGDTKVTVIDVQSRRPRRSAPTKSSCIPRCASVTGL